MSLFCAWDDCGMIVGSTPTENAIGTDPNFPQELQVGPQLFEERRVLGLEESLQ